MKNKDIERSIQYYVVFIENPLIMTQESKIYGKQKYVKIFNNNNNNRRPFPEPATAVQFFSNCSAAPGPKKGQTRKNRKNNNQNKSREELNKQCLEGNGVLVGW